MKILLIGNFAPPYEEEILHNFSLLTKLRQDNNECSVLNISEHPAVIEGIIDVNGYIDYVSKLIRLARGRDVIHFLTKGYTRLGLLKLALSVLLGRLFHASPIITFHSELLSIIGLTRSPFGGQQTMNFTFSRAHRIIFTEKDTQEVASVYKKKDNLTLVPSFISIPELSGANVKTLREKLKNRKKIIAFTNVVFPSFLFNILDNLLAREYDPDIGIVVSIADKPSVKLQHVMEEASGQWMQNLIFIEPDSREMLSMAYAEADLILKTLSCDGKMFFPNFAVSMKKPVRSENTLYFPNSHVIVKGGKSTDLTADIIQNVLLQKPKTGADMKIEDGYGEIKKIYTE
jgi:hypothetical protein